MLQNHLFDVSVRPTVFLLLPIYVFCVFNRWGLQNEDLAREAYRSVMENQHIDFNISASGLMINPDLPWIGASPDGVVSCACHGMGVLELKCPFTAKSRSLNECAGDSQFCLSETEGMMALKQHHGYMYQVQAQMRVADFMFADFVVWTPQELFIQRIFFDDKFFDEAYLKVEAFIKTGILPELLGKWVTVPRLSSCDATDQADGCYCGNPNNDEVLACISKICKRKFFHKACLKLTRVPKKWMCVECRKLSKKK